jgi:SAM-dependent methyltransferase
MKAIHTEENDRAVSYCGTRPDGGLCHLEILRSEGLVATSKVLEIGCGALMAAIPIMSFVQPGHYFGMEPNIFLIEQSMKIKENKDIVFKQKPTFIVNDEFDASAVNVQFDCIFAHSIMSHASQSQLPLFIANCSRSLCPGGRLIFSLRLTEPNQYGGEGSPNETNSPTWVYPGCSFFHKSTVLNECAKHFSKTRFAPEYIAKLMGASKGHCHDWVVATK